MLLIRKKCTHNLAAVWQTNILYSKVVLGIVGVDRDLSPAPRDLVDICEQLYIRTNPGSYHKHSNRELREEHNAG